MKGEQVHQQLSFTNTERLQCAWHCARHWGSTVNKTDVVPAAGAADGDNCCHLLATHRVPGYTFAIILSLPSLQFLRNQEKNLVEVCSTEDEQ